MAFAYVARFATTRAKLTKYLTRKLAERGWEGDARPDPRALAEEMAGKGYIDDSDYAAIKAGSLMRRGYGQRRVANMLFADGIEEADRGGAEQVCVTERTSAIVALARRRRFGPFADAPADEKARARQLATMIRAGHDFGLAKKLLDLGPEWRDEAIEDMLAD